MGGLTITTEDDAQWEKFFKVTIKNKIILVLISYDTIPFKNIPF